jgi:carboxypeptidase C (cathepsin A)
VYTGYVDVTGARHLFFTYFESRRDPENDDVVLWLNGGACQLCRSVPGTEVRCIGPGGSATVGMLMELGPSRLSISSSSAIDLPILLSCRSLHGRLDQLDQV